MDIDRKIELARKYALEIEKDQHPLYFLSPWKLKMFSYAFVSLILLAVLSIGLAVFGIVDKSGMQFTGLVFFAVFILVTWGPSVYLLWISRAREKAIFVLFLISLIAAIILIPIALLLKETFVALLLLFAAAAAIIIPMLWGVWAIFTYVSPGQFYQKYKDRL